MKILYCRTDLVTEYLASCRRRSRSARDGFEGGPSADIGPDTADMFSSSRFCRRLSEF